MQRQNYQARGPVKRTVLVTVRVVPEQREVLHRLADERGETLSRMLLSPWLTPDGQKPQKRSAKKVAQPVAEAPAAADACESDPRLRARSVVTRVRAVSDFGDQGTLFPVAGGDR
jgi:hypothetical protein